MSVERSSRKRKGQVEFIVVIILVAIGVATVSYAIFVSSPEIFQGTQETKTVKDSILSFISEAGYDTLQRMSLYGGYLEPAQNYVLYEPQHNIQEVNYYYYQGETYYPTQDEIEANLASGIAYYILEYKDALQYSLESQGAEIGDPESIDVKILENKVVISVTMPTTVKNQTLQQPFDVELITRFGEIYKLGKGLVDMNTQDGYFESFTFAEMLSKPSGGSNSVPIFIPPQFDCDPIYIGWESMRSRVENSIEYVVANTYVSGDEKRAGRAYMLPSVDDKTYDGINIKFDVPSDFRLDYDDFQFRTSPDGNINSISIQPQRLDYTAERCISTPVVVDYYIKYPVVAVITDEVTRDSFRFAFEVFRGGSNVELEATSAEYTAADFQTDTTSDFANAITIKEVCEEMKCSARILVKDIDENPISHASISFGGCPLGETDDSGVFSGFAPCIMGKLEISKAGYSPSYKTLSADSISDGELMYLKETAPVNLRIYEVPVVKKDGNYSITASDITLLNGEAEIQFWNALSPEREVILNKPAGKVELSQGTIYSVAAYLRAVEKREYEGGFAGYAVTVAYGDDLHIYIPKLEGFETLRGNDMLTELNRLTKLLLKSGCGIEGPARKTQATPKSCSYKAEELSS